MNGTTVNGIARNYSSMANPTHETILRGSKEGWNQWRLEHPDINPDLCGLSWPGCHLNLYDLTFADLRDATLYGGEFSHSFFEGANLQDANLNSTYLFHADLKGANLA